MGWLDQVPRAGNLYIGGLGALFQTQLIQGTGITHILSAIDYDVDAKQLQGMTHLSIHVEDSPDQNILQYFDVTSAFIHDALAADGGVLVHCAMGKSRSAAIVCAYLMGKYGIDPTQALGQVCEGRPVCQPNMGFMRQLSVYQELLRAEDVVRKERIMQQYETTRFRGKSWEWDTAKQEFEKPKL